MLMRRKASFPHEPALDDFFLPAYLVSENQSQLLLLLRSFSDVWNALLCRKGRNSREALLRVFFPLIDLFSSRCPLESRRNGEGMSYFITCDDDNDINKLFKESVDYGGKDKRFSLGQRKKGATSSNIKLGLKKDRHTG